MYIIPFIPTSFLRDPDQAMLQYRISLQNFPLSFKRGTFPFESEEVYHFKADNNFRCNTHNILIYSIHNSTRAFPSAFPLGNKAHMLLYQDSTKNGQNCKFLDQGNV